MTKREPILRRDERVNPKGERIARSGQRISSIGHGFPGKRPRIRRSRSSILVIDEPISFIRLPIRRYRKKGA